MVDTNGTRSTKPRRVLLVVQHINICSSKLRVLEIALLIGNQGQGWYRFHFRGGSDCQDWRSDRLYLAVCAASPNSPDCDERRCSWVRTDLGPEIVAGRICSRGPGDDEHVNCMRLQPDILLTRFAVIRRGCKMRTSAQTSLLLFGSCSPPCYVFIEALCREHIMRADVVLCITLWPPNSRPVVTHIRKFTRPDEIAIFHSRG